MSVVTLERIGAHVALVTINRPEIRNAVSVAVATELEAIVKQVEADNEIWVAILTGAGGKAFCAGADLNQVLDGRMEELFTAEGAFAGFVKHPRDKVWIAAVEGFAMAGGCEIALACDMIVASRTAEFGLSEVMRGLVAAAGGMYRLPRAVPRNIAMELLATGDRLSAERAAGFGMVNRLADAGCAVAEALVLAERICNNAPLAVQASLKIARQAFDHSDDELFARGFAAYQSVKSSDDFQEGLRAFLGKRKPAWRNR